jgi:hypothetical protein
VFRGGQRRGLALDQDDDERPVELLEGVEERGLTHYELQRRRGAAFPGQADGVADDRDDVVRLGRDRDRLRQFGFADLDGQGRPDRGSAGRSAHHDGVAQEHE